jgi:glycosyltransferase involved in cell wall biosynthesis
LEWLTLQIKDHFDLKVILLGKANTEHEEFLRVHNIPTFHVLYQTKSDFFQAAKRTWRLLKSEKPKLIHTHFWLANIIGIPLSFWLRIPSRVMTRHHGNLHHLFYRKGVWMDILLNRLSTYIISPTEGIKNLMIRSEYTNSRKIQVINHGIDLDYYGTATPTQVEVIRQKYKIPNTSPVVGVISRHIEWKGIQYIIPAFEQIIRDTPTAHLILANANGEYKKVINDMLSKIPSGSYTLIEYENDIAALYSIFDVFVHVPIDLYSESFGLIYVEALASGKPCVFTLSGIAADFVVHEHNALVVDYRSTEQISASIRRLILNNRLANEIARNGKNSIGRFSVEAMGQMTRAVYFKQFSK